jgi:predicted nuclease of predicted toxin-antitoxin system
MRLLFDQNLSFRLVALLAAEYPGSDHVRNVGLSTANDEAIWQFAAQQQFAIVSKDSDFQYRALLQGNPPKVVWVRLGNCTTITVAELLRSRQPDLLAFEADVTASILVLC